MIQEIPASSLNMWHNGPNICKVKDLTEFDFVSHLNSKSSSNFYGSSTGTFTMYLQIVELNKQKGIDVYET